MSRTILPALAILFFLSGASALVYQVLWLRLLGLVFGITIHAATTVLASFMGGLAIGSLAAGRLASRVRHPLRWFGVAELLIAAAALLTQPALAALAELYVSVHPALKGFPAAVTAMRFAGASLILLVPTALMGASLPLVLQSSLARDPRIGSRFAALYASNSGGAIVGTLLVGYVLIEQIGIAASFRLAASVNVLVGLCALVLSRRTGAVDPPAADTSPAPLRISRDDALVLLVFAISGFAALAFEIVWFRLLVLFVPATTYAFTTMLAAVLFGIAAGSALAAPRLRHPGPSTLRQAQGRPELGRGATSPRAGERRTLACVELAIGFVAMLSLTALASTYRAGWRTSGTIQASLLTIAPATILMGLAFPLGVRLLTRDGEGARAATARVALLYAVNVSAAIAGAIVAGFVLIPHIGTRPSLIVVAALHALAALLLMDLRKRRGVLTVLAIALAFVGAALMVPDPVTAVLGRRYPAAERLWWREEGAQSTVSVHVRPGGGRQILYLDGLHQANDSPEMVRVHRQIGHLPMALHPSPRQALVIGLGAGATAGAVSQHPGVEVTLVELSASVVRASALFKHINDAVVEQPNVRVSIDDARNHLLLAQVRYDVITADIIQPIHAGAGNLYSREYFSLVRKAMADDGLALQWIGHRQATPYRLILRTFLSVFPHTTLWADGTLMVGSRQPLRIDRAAFEKKLVDPRTRAALADVGLGTTDALLASYTAGPEELHAFVGEGPVLSDDHPRIEYFGSLPEGEHDIDLRGLRGDVRRHLVTR